MQWREKIETWGKQYGEKAFVLAVFVVTLTLTFEAGVLWQGSHTPQALVVKVPEMTPATEPVKKVAPEKGGGDAVPPSKTNQTCAFVGSKNSNKYHVPTSRCAKQIKSSNLICFANEEAARTKGYLPGCLTP